MTSSPPEPVSTRSILRQWPFILGAFVIVFVGLIWYITSIPVRYASNSVVAFQPQPGRADGRDLISLLIETYPELVASEASVDTAATAAGVSPVELRSGLDAQIPPLTLNMTITTELADAGKAQIANQSLVDQVIAQGKADPFLVATAISNADFNETPSGVSRRLLYALAFVLAATTAVLAGILASRVSASLRRASQKSA